MTIPASVTSIGELAFYGCTGLTSIRWSENQLQQRGGVLYNKSLTTLIQYPEGKTGSVTIPASVTSIGYGRSPVAAG